MRNNYLQHMGITIWHLREADYDQCAQYFQCDLKNSAGKTVGLIVSEIDNNIELSEQENLLQKIAESLTLYYKLSETSVGPPRANLELNFVLDISLSDLLKTPENKKKLWAEMKPLKKYFV